MENANYQALPSTPSDARILGPRDPGLPSPSLDTNNIASNLNNVLATAEKKREVASNALNTVKKALKENIANSPIAKTRHIVTKGSPLQHQLVHRVSPGHFLLSTALTNSQKARSLALGSPISPISPSYTTNNQTPSPHHGVASNRLAALQKRHSELLAACQEAETASMKANEQKKKAIEDAQEARDQLKELRRQIEAVNAEYDARRDQLSASIKQLHEEKIQAEIALEEAQNRLALGETPENQEHCHHPTFSTTAEKAAQEAEARFTAATVDLEAVNQEIESKRAQLRQTESLAVEAESMLEEKESRAREAQWEWEEAEQRLGCLESELVELTGRLEAKRQILVETEQKCESLEREITHAELQSKTAKRAAQVAEEELAVVHKRLDEARSMHVEAQLRAAVAKELAQAEEVRATQAAQTTAAFEKMSKYVQEMEQTLVQLREEVDEAESMAILKSRLECVNEEKAVLVAELEREREVNQAAEEKACRAKELNEEAERRMHEAISEVQSLTATMEAEMHRMQEELTKERATRQLLESHEHYQVEIKLLGAELIECQQQLERAADAAHLAAQRAAMAEKQVVAADSQLTRALEERDAAMDRLESVTIEIFDLKKEIEQQEATIEDLTHHNRQLNKLVKDLKAENRESKTCIDTLQLQIESLQDRLRTETTKTKMMMRHKKQNEEEDQDQLHTEVDRLKAQNAALKATANRLSHALAVALKANNTNITREDEDFIPAYRMESKEPPV